MLGESGLQWAQRLHQQLAKELKARGWSQMDIADIVGTTQSTVSRQLVKPPQPLPASNDEVVVDDWAHELAESLHRLGPSTEVLQHRIVLELTMSNNQTLRYDKTLSGLHMNDDQAMQAVLRRLEWATARFDVKRLEGYMPAVGLNIAASNGVVTSPQNVAAYPGRMTVVDGRLHRHETAVFGASTHLANLLIQAQKTDPSIGAIMNIRPPMLDGMVDRGDIDYISDELGFSVGLSVRGELQSTTDKVTILVDEGDFGWEPSMYILGKTPADLVDRCHVIIDAMNTE